MTSATLTELPPESAPDPDWLVDAVADVGSPRHVRG